MPVDEASNDVGQAAVRGTNTAGGDGIVGRGHRGVVGESDDYQGVYGKSGANAGVVGEAAKFHGIFGVSHGVNNAGVLGTNDAAGYGVIALSEQGVGISAKGGKLAGRFEGIVEVTGALVVAGVDVGSRIRALERELAALKERVRVLEGRAGGGGAAATANIGVELRHTGGNFDELRVFGSGFSANENVEISLESLSRYGDGRQAAGSSTAQARADGGGRINQTVSVSCPAGVQTTHTARARGLSSGNLSNTAGAAC